jgi:hypothetical protein
VYRLWAKEAKRSTLPFACAPRIVPCYIGSSLFLFKTANRLLIKHPTPALEGHRHKYLNHHAAVNSPTLRNPKSSPPAPRPVLRPRCRTPRPRRRLLHLPLLLIFLVLTIVVHAIHCRPRRGCRGWSTNLKSQPRRLAGVNHCVGIRVWIPTPAPACDCGPLPATTNVVRRRLVRGASNSL